MLICYIQVGAKNCNLLNLHLLSHVTGVSHVSFGGGIVFRYGMLVLIVKMNTSLHVMTKKHVKRPLKQVIQLT